MTRSRDDITLGEARHDFEAAIGRIRDRKQKSIQCELCGENYTLYPRKITSAMARFLMELAKLSGERRPWLNALEVFKTAGMKYDGDYAKLRFWKLIEGTDDEESPRAGLYRITDLGKQFVKGDLELARVAYIFHDTLFGFGGNLTNVKKALGDRFDYEEIMAA